MTAEIRIYYEGDRNLRPGFREFFKQFYQSSIRISLVPCQANTIADFMSGIRRFPNALNVLLIDSEGPYTPAFLQRIRQNDHWDTSVGSQVADEQLHFMVQVMESWFLADRQALRNYYGQDFAENRLPPNPNLEQILKNDVLDGLADATRTTTKGRYHKTKHAPDLMASVSPAAVRSAAPACERLFSVLEQHVAPLN